MNEPQKILRAIIAQENESFLVNWVDSFIKGKDPLRPRIFVPANFPSPGAFLIEILYFSRDQELMEVLGEAAGNVFLTSFSNGSFADIFNRGNKIVVNDLLGLVEALPCSPLLAQKLIDSFYMLLASGIYRGNPGEEFDIHRSILLAMSSKISQVFYDRTELVYILFSELTKPEYAASAFSIILRLELKLASKKLATVIRTLQKAKLPTTYIMLDIAQCLRNRPGGSKAIMSAIEQLDDPAIINEFNNHLKSIDVLSPPDKLTNKLNSLITDFKKLWKIYLDFEKSGSKVTQNLLFSLDKLIKFEMDNKLVFLSDFFQNISHYYNEFKLLIEQWLFRNENFEGDQYYKSIFLHIKLIEAGFDEWKGRFFFMHRFLWEISDSLNGREVISLRLDFQDLLMKHMKDLFILQTFNNEDDWNNFEIIFLSYLNLRDKEYKLLNRDEALNITSILELLQNIHREIFGTCKYFDDSCTDDDHLIDLGQTILSKWLFLSKQFDLFLIKEIIQDDRLSEDVLFGIKAIQVGSIGGREITANII